MVTWKGWRKDRLLGSEVQGTNMGHNKQKYSNERRCQNDVSQILLTLLGGFVGVIGDLLGNFDGESEVGKRWDP